MIRRRSPVRFKVRPEKMVKNDWDIILKYKNETKGPYLIDLSHVSKWDVQGENLSTIKPFGLPMPETQGACIFKNDILIHLVKWNWAIIYQLGEQSGNIPQEKAFTDVTEAYALLALIGNGAFDIMENVTAMDLKDPEKESPFLMLGPVLHVRSQVVVLKREQNDPAILIACARGYGQSMANALLDAGKSYGISPGGFSVFTSLIK